MRIIADGLLAVWSVLNIGLAAASRRALKVAVVFGMAGALVALGLLAGSLAAVIAGLAASIAAPWLYGLRVAGQNHLSHHVVRGLVVIALATLYVLS